MELLLTALGVVAFLLGVHLAALFAERRGRIYYMTRPPRVRVLGLFEELVNPSFEHRIGQETSEAIRTDRSEWGEGYGEIDGSD